MTLADFATIASILSSIAVVASLVYLGLQTRQNVKHTRALIHQGRAARNVAHLLASADADLAAAFIVGNGGEPTLEEVKHRQFLLLSTTLVSNWEETFTQHSEGLMSDDQFGSFRGALRFPLGERGIREFWNHWKTARPDTNATFKAFIDEIISTLPTATPPIAPTQ